MAIKKYDPNQIKTGQDLMTLRVANEAHYQKSCHNILSIIIFTAINIFLLVTNSNTYFLFSAAMPRMLVDFGMALCGKYPPEYYGGDISGYSFFSDAFFAVTIAGAILILGVYLLCWFLGKKRKVAWLIVALVLFVFDTLLFFYMYGFDASMIIDLIFRGWIIISLATGIEAHFILKKAPTEFPTVASYTSINSSPEAETAITEETPKETTEINPVDNNNIA